MDTYPRANGDIIGLYRTITAPLRIESKTSIDWQTLGQAVGLPVVGPLMLADIALRGALGKEKHGDLEWMIVMGGLTLASPILVPLAIGAAAKELVRPSKTVYRITDGSSLRPTPDASCAALYFGEDAKNGPARFSSLSFWFPDGTQLQEDGVGIYGRPEDVIRERYSSATCFLPLAQEIHATAHRLRTEQEIYRR